MPERVEVWVKEDNISQWQWEKEERSFMWIIVRMQGSMEGSLWCPMRMIWRCKVVALEGLLPIALIPSLGYPKDSIVMSGVCWKVYGLVDLILRHVLRGVWDSHCHKENPTICMPFQTVHLRVKASFQINLMPELHPSKMPKDYLEFQESL